jgi:hypothetical protein
MNDKIKSIRTQAVDWVQHQLETVGSDHPVMEREQLEMVNAKFAELIIQECAQYVDDNFYTCGDALTDGQRLMKHFGVK